MRVFWNKYSSCLDYQIISPHDRGIADAIKNNLAPRVWDIPMLELLPRVHNQTEQLRNAYFSYVEDMSYSRFVARITLLTAFFV